MLWPNTHCFPSRSKTNLDSLMSLSTIQSDDAPSKRKVFKQRPVTSLITEDIEGAKPLLKGYQYINKPEYSNSTNDIEKSSAKPLHPSLNKPEYNLKTSDIDKAQSNLSNFKSTRFTNPLNPVYKLPSYEVKPVTPPKFVRDSINIDDISGAKPEKYFKYATRDHINVRDIEGAKPEPEKVLVKPNFMDPKDINGEAFRSKRNCNPLDPSYVHREEDGSLKEIGVIAGSKPKVSMILNREPHRRHLESDDIDGARPGTVGMGVFASRQRNYTKDLVNNNDIEGCKPGTLKKGITTKRATNPLNPDYTWPTEEDPKPQDASQKPPEAKTQPNLKSSDKNNQNFWGCSVNQSQNLNLKEPSSRPSTSKPFLIRQANSMNYMRNVNKFFEVSSDGEGFNANCEKFYDNSNKRLEDKFLAAQNPRSIHRMKKSENKVNAVGFENDAKKFFNTDARSSRPSSCNSYQFKLSRKNIALPVESL